MKKALKLVFLPALSKLLLLFTILLLLICFTSQSRAGIVCAPVTDGKNTAIVTVQLKGVANLIQTIQMVNMK